MSLKTAHIVPRSYFYPAGNTPAVCLTQSLPPDQDAALLLLGCGDIRNLLFTAYAGIGLENRKIDVTCCDLEPEILARNILALTLITEDTDGVRSQKIWDLYYHVHIDRETLLYLQSQAKKLLHHAQSIDDWHKGLYGDFVRFCNTTTFTELVKMWRLYAIDSSEPEKFNSEQNSLRMQWKSAQEHRTRKIGKESMVLNSIRAYAPLFRDAIVNAPKHYREYWNNNGIVGEPNSLKAFKYLNPMFASLRNRLVLHYGTDPLTGYHLSTVFAQLSEKTPLNPFQLEQNFRKTSCTATKAALVQFKDWSDAFRKCYNRLTLRFVSSDAIAFCNVLQHYRATGESSTAYWYCSSREYRPFILNGPDYGSETFAPTSFDVIDTSNLMDHIGSLNVLTASRPLLLKKPSSTIRTELLVPRKASVTESAKALLCGDLPTIALHLGLKPVQHWTGATATWNFNEATHNDSILRKVFSRHIILWKHASTGLLGHGLQYDAKILAEHMYTIYLEIFKDESWAHGLQLLKLDSSQIATKMRQHPIYTRGSLVAMLHAIRQLNGISWSQFVDEFLEIILQDSALNMGAHYFQSLGVHLQILGTSTSTIRTLWHMDFYQQELSIGLFRDWKAIPPILCLTMSVPQGLLDIFKDSSNGTPACHLMTQSSINTKQCIYPDVQMGFGTISTSGKSFTNEYAVHIHEDEKGWNGEAPLIVSAMVSTYSLIAFGDPACEIHFGLMSTYGTVHLTHKLGTSLNIHRSAVGRSDVFITRYRPNMPGHMSIGCTMPLEIPNSPDFSVQMFPIFDAKRIKLISMRIHLDVLADEVKKVMQNGSKVNFALPNPFTLILDIDHGHFSRKFELPVPLDKDRGKGKIARKSGWLEYSAPLASSSSLSLSPDLMFPMRMDNSPGLLLDHLHYISPGTMPQLQYTLSRENADWILSLMSPLATMSSSELKEFGSSTAKGSYSNSARVDFKNTLCSMVASFLGHSKIPRSSVFSISNNYSVGIPILFHLNSIRMDLSNQSFFLDAAATPLDYGMLDRYSGVRGTYHTKMVAANVSNAELVLWKHLLPAFAERCREWQHKSTCEYHNEGRVPLSTEPGKRFMCSCGFGVFPKGYMHVPKWEELMKFSVRVAIPVCYWSPISENEWPKLSSPMQTGSHIPYMSSKDDSCFECGAGRTQNGSSLMKCARCKYALYCSTTCQKANCTKTHKHVCKKMKGMTNEA
ncbi:hypothetical protein CC78DRAFT_579231 [Lojkania enalia]|uniref:MYND-type domain-containing protein n=1 Tax=Lojkania enalia TaxID=147567 RepID=A0A9P4KG47_9PLEO|nr:hypothetical protein CC78DRAFT_579231 [Didymosphaeria enalia]